MQTLGQRRTIVICGLHTRRCTSGLVVFMQQALPPASWLGHLCSQCTHFCLVLTLLPSFPWGDRILLFSNFPLSITSHHASLQGVLILPLCICANTFLSMKNGIAECKTKILNCTPDPGIQCTFLSTVHDRGAVNFPLCDQILQLFAFLPLGSNFLRKAFHNPTK